MIVMPDLSRPSRSAAAIMAWPIRSLMLPSGLANSPLIAMVASRPRVMRLSFTRGVRPTVLMMS